MFARDLFSLGAARPRPGGPDTGKDSEGAIFAQRKPRRRLFRLGVGIFAKRGPWHDATVFGFEPASPVRRLGIANIRNRRAAEYGRPRHAPTQHRKFAHA